MRSLAKKAEHSARLENLAREALEDYRASRETLQKLINTAIGLRTSLNNVPEDLEKFVSEVEASINRATSALVDVEEDPDAMKLPDHDLHVNGDIADNK